MPPADDAPSVSDPQGEVPSPFVFKMSQMNATQLDGGSVKVVDSTMFPVSIEIAVADITVEPGAMRYVQCAVADPGQMIHVSVIFRELHVSVSTGLNDLCPLTFAS